MLALIFGGSGSGKSAYAEDLAVRISSVPRYYLATMVGCDSECQQRIARHRQQRQDKGFFHNRAGRRFGTMQFSAGEHSAAGVFIYLADQ